MKINKNASKFFNMVPSMQYRFSASGGYLNNATATPVVNTDPTPSGSRFEHLPNVKEFTVGAGVNAVHITPEGLWMGAEKKEDAPVRVLPDGRIYIHNPIENKDKALLGLIPTS